MNDLKELDRLAMDFLQSDPLDQDKRMAYLTKYRQCKEAGLLDKSETKSE